MVFAVAQHALRLQLGQHARQCAAIHPQVGGHARAVKGDIKGERGLPDGLGGQVGQQLFAGGPFADMGDLIVKKQYFVCQNADQIADEFLVVVADAG